MALWPAFAGQASPIQKNKGRVYRVAALRRCGVASGQSFSLTDLKASYLLEDMPVIQQYANTSMPCILLVDDEAAVRDFLGRAFPQFGLAVLSASSGSEAVRLYRQHEGTISAA